MKAAIWLGCVLALSACQPGGSPLDALYASADGEAPGVDPYGKGVDAMQVGHQMMASGEYDLALRAYYRAAADDGLSADVMASIGSADLKLGRLGQAETALRQAVKMDPTFVPALNNLGVVLMSEGKYGEAKSYFQQAYALDSGNTDEIRQNLKLAIDQMENLGYGDEAPTEEEPKFNLVRQGDSTYELLSNY